MDFFARQELARRRTWWLVVLFFGALAGLIVSAYVAIAGMIQVALIDPASADGSGNRIVWDPGLLLGIGSVVSLIVLGGTMFKLSQLRHGGGRVAEMLGGRPIDPASTQFHERRLLNVVEEMALASGVSVPPVYVLRGQTGINAFAAGYSIHDAVIGITEGAMRGLRREELQGVIGHEFSHILNGDMRLNIRLIGIVHGLLLLAIVGRVLIRMASSGRSSSNKKGGGVALFIALGLALIVIGYAGYFFGGLIKRAVSRQREYLADASAVQFTRHPLGLASALKKVGGLAQGGVVKNDHAEELSHMFFADGIKRLFGGGSLFATHPPLARRVKLLDPDFNGEFPAITEDMLYLNGNEEPTPQSARTGEAQKPATGVMGKDFIRRTVAVGETMATQPAAILQHIGVLEATQVDAVASMMEDLPDSIRRAIREPMSAQGVVLAILIGASDGESADAWTWIPASLSSTVSEFLDQISAIPLRRRFMILEMAVPAIRTLSQSQAERLLELIDQIIHSDQRINLIEFAIQEVISSGLREILRMEVPRIVHHNLNDVMNEVGLLFNVLAQSGRQSDETARRSFDAAKAHVGAPGEVLAYQAADTFNLDECKSALNRLRQVTMPVRKVILEAMLVCLMADEQVADKEAALFYATAASLEVPVPPALLL